MNSFRNRWWTVAGASMAQIVGVGPLLQFTFSVFLLPLATAFGVDRGTISIALTSSLLATALSIPLAGRLIDRYDLRILITGAVMTLAAGLVLVGVLASSLTSFVILYVLIGIVASLNTPVAYAKVITLQFDRDRGLALGIALTGVGIGTIIVPQIAQALITAFGWRMAYVGLAGLLIVIAVPSIQLCMSPRPALPDVGSTESTGLNLREAVRSSAFWKIVAGTFLAALAANGTIAHLVPLATDRGFAPHAAVRFLSVAGLSSIVGRLLAGRLADRLWAPLVVAAFLVLGAAGIALLIVGQAVVPIWIGAVCCIGLSLGAEADLIGLVLSRYCGRRAFGQLFGLLFASFILASSLGPLVMGTWFGRAGSYDGALYMFIASLVFAGMIFLTLGDYRFPRGKH